VRPGCALVALVITASGARAAGVGCISSDERRWVAQAYDKYASKYDVTKQAQALIELNHATIDAEDRLAACRNSGKGAPEECAALTQQVQSTKMERQRAADRLNSALQMQPYVTTLHIRLEQPTCP
jgi:hypothetical protein